MLIDDLENLQDEIMDLQYKMTNTKCVKCRLKYQEAIKALQKKVDDKRYEIFHAKYNE